MKLNETFQSDLATFFNPDEFASPAIIDGRPVLIVLDDDSLKEYNFKAEGEGLAIGTLLFHVPVSSLKKELFLEKDVIYGNSQYRIIDLKENLGVYTVILEGYEA